jgi:predicted nucleotidyltransferase
MLSNYNKFKVLEVFLDNPLPSEGYFQLREISRLVNLAPKSVKLYLNELIDEEFVMLSKNRITNHPTYFGNFDNSEFRFLKKLNNQLKLKKSGLISYIKEKCFPGCIILFGSYSKGEDLVNSDIDLFVESKYTYLDLLEFEVKLNRKINVLFENNFEKLSKELKSNLVNGIIIDGYLKWKA